MPDSKFTEQQLSQLLADTLAISGPDPELMVRYAEAPESLSDDERQQLEDYLASSPAAADELRVLQSFNSNTAKAKSTHSNKELTIETTSSHHYITRFQTWFSELTSTLTAEQWVPISVGLSIILAIPLFLSPGNQDEFAFIEPQYIASNDSNSPYWLDSKVRSAGSLSLTVIAPNHVATTSTAQPELYWLLSKLPQAGEFNLVLTDVENSETLTTIKLSPKTSGIQVISIKKFNINLKLNIQYRWVVSYSNDTEEIYSIGGIEYKKMMSEIHKKLLKANPGSKANVFASNGYWYDAVTNVHQLQQRHVNNLELKKAWQLLINDSQSTYTE